MPTNNLNSRHCAPSNSDTSYSSVTPSAATRADCHVCSHKSRLSCVQPQEQTVMCAATRADCHVCSHKSRLSCVQPQEQTVMCAVTRADCHVCSHKSRLSCVQPQTVMLKRLICNTVKPQYTHSLCVPQVITLAVGQECVVFLFLLNMV